MGRYDSHKKEVLEASLWLSEHGYFGSLRGTGGNVSVRIGKEPLMAITPSSVKYGELSPDDICVVGLDRAVVEGRLAPSVESGMHAAVCSNRPDVSAVVHTHQIFGSVFALIGEPVPPLFDEVSFALGESVEVIPYGPSGSQELADNVARRLANNANAYIIQNHGIIALGQDLDGAVLCAELVEKVARIYRLALGTGKPVTTLPELILEAVREKRGREIAEAQKKVK